MLGDHAPSTNAVHILGAGCAGLSLAARAGDLPAYDFSISDPYMIANGMFGNGVVGDSDDAPDHIWGFWHGPGMDAAAQLARHSWHSWRIITPSSSSEMQSDTRPYMAVNRSTWLADCYDKARLAGVAFADAPPDNSEEPQIIDGRTPPMPKGVMIQHFIGWEISAETPCFNPDVAVLMDFRCDQSRGLHFIYLLPFSTTEALVESTMFSPDLQEDAFYQNAIRENLATHYGCDSFTVNRKEKGAIPMAEIAAQDPLLTAIGANGGAIRPSSGYAFAFIQKQIADGITRDQQTQKVTGPSGLPDSGDTQGRALRFTSPHHPIDILMDRVFLYVLRQWPQGAPGLFARMAAALTGDEFAAFMSGQAGWVLRIKVILAMPKWPFVRALIPALLAGRA